MCIRDSLSAWAEVASELPWTRPYGELWVPGANGGEWFAGGQLNASAICVDQHLPQRADQVAILWEGEPGDRRSLTFQQLHDEVLALTRGLRGLGVVPGDRVVLHLGWLPETVVAMLACARIGAVHTIIPTPLPAEALADRLEDLAPKILFTQDGAWRRGAVLPLKTRADEALSAVAGVEQTIVIRRTGMDVAWYEGDRWYHDLVAGTRPGRQVEDRLGDASPASLPASHPLIAVNLANRHRQRHGQLHRSAPTWHQPRWRVLVRGRRLLARRPGPRNLRSARLRRHHGHVRGHARRANTHPRVGGHPAIRHRNPVDVTIGRAHHAGLVSRAAGHGLGQVTGSGRHDGRADGPRAARMAGARPGPRRPRRRRRLGPGRAGWDRAAGPSGGPVDDARLGPGHRRRVHR